MAISYVWRNGMCGVSYRQPASNVMWLAALVSMALVTQWRKRAAAAAALPLP